jgi:hypothetical protein
MSSHPAVALGVRDLSGRDVTGQAVLVALRRDDSGPERILDRRDIDLAGGDYPPRVYHAAAGLSPDAAEALVAEAAEAATRQAQAELGACLAELRGLGHAVDVVAVPLDEGDDVAGAPLAEVLASHRLIHVAEQQLYRDALAGAAAREGVAVVRYAVSSLARAADDIGCPPGEVPQRLASWVREVGRPWRRPHKDAALAAWTTLGR